MTRPRELTRRPFNDAKRMGFWDLTKGPSTVTIKKYQRPKDFHGGGTKRYYQRIGDICSSAREAVNLSKVRMVIGIFKPFNSAWTNGNVSTPLLLGIEYLEIHLSCMSI